MSLALPLIATAAALPVAVAARVGLAAALGFYAGLTKSGDQAMVKLARTSSIKIALFVSSAVWAAWAISRLI